MIIGKWSPSLSPIFSLFFPFKLRHTNKTDKKPINIFKTLPDQQEGYIANIAEDPKMLYGWSWQEHSFRFFCQRNGENNSNQKSKKNEESERYVLKEKRDEIHTFWIYPLHSLNVPDLVLHKITNKNRKTHIRNTHKSMSRWNCKMTKKS